MRGLFSGIIRAFAFLRTEVFEVLRQPRLVLTLVLGPFLILLLFGLGYRNTARDLRTQFVVPDMESELARQIEQYATTLGPQLLFMGVTEDEAQALDRLRRREVDVVAVAPPNPYQTIRNNQQVVLTLYHNEIDPYQIEYIKVFGQVYVDEVNRRILKGVIAEETQASAAPIDQSIAQAKGDAAALREALLRGDTTAARQHQDALDQKVSAVELAAGAALRLFGGVQQTFGAPVADGEALSGETLAAFVDLRQQTSALEDIPEGKSDYSVEAQQVTQIENDLTLLESDLGSFQNLDPNVIVTPFRSDVRSVATVQPELSHYFAPSVIALLLQHLAVTFAALSIVRERALGTMELFRVSPISAGEMLIGKYASYLIFGGLIAAALTALLYFALGVPMLGDWRYYALALAGLLFASLGIGFVISLISQTDSQAVQYSMIVLLTSVFFSGFILALETLWAPVRTISWALPATYAIILLRDIMLRGALPNAIFLGGLGAIGLALLVVAWLLLRRRMARI
jgi:ABC-2 type transport system permease protein